MIVASIFIIFCITIYCIFIIIYRQKMNKIENKLQNKFKVRNNKVVSIYYASKDYLNKHDEVFKEYFKLKETDFLQDTKNFYFENKLDIYKKFQSEINFIFKICEMNMKLKQDKKYNYIKESILKQSKSIWKEYDIYKKEIEKYRKYHKISKFFLIWLFIR